MRRNAHPVSPRAGYSIRVRPCARARPSGWLVTECQHLGGRSPLPPARVARLALEMSRGFRLQPEGCAPRKRKRTLRSSVPRLVALYVSPRCVTRGFGSAELVAATVSVTRPASACLAVALQSRRLSHRRWLRCRSRQSRRPPTVPYLRVVLAVWAELRPSRSSSRSERLSTYCRETVAVNVTGG